MHPIKLSLIRLGSGELIMIPFEVRSVRSVNLSVTIASQTAFFPDEPSSFPNNVGKSQAIPSILGTYIR